MDSTPSLPLSANSGFVSMPCGSLTTAALAVACLPGIDDLLRDMAAAFTSFIHPTTEMYDGASV